MTSAVAIILSAAILAVTQAAVLNSGVTVPTFANVCHRSQPDLDECFKDSIQTLIQKISRDGIRPLQIKSLDPWNVPEQSFTYGNGQPFKIAARMFDSNTYGFSKLQILGVRSSLENPKKISFDIDFSNKKIHIEGNYDVQGIISDVPVNGRGKYNISLGDVRGTFHLKGHLVKRDGKEFLLVDRATMFPDVGEFRFQMTNENNKYSELTNLATVLFNTFWKNMYAEMRPLAEETFNQIMTPVINMATLKIPYDQLIPE